MGLQDLKCLRMLVCFFNQNLLLIISLNLQPKLSSLPISIKLCFNLYIVNSHHVGYWYKIFCHKMDISWERLLSFKLIDMALAHEVLKLHAAIPVSLSWCQLTDKAFETKKVIELISPCFILVK
jgi:hypothetical protein